MASEQVRVAVGLAELPDTATAYASGGISFEHACAVVASARRLGEAAMAGGAEKLLLAQARDRSAGWVHRLGRHLHERLDPDGSQDTQRRLQEDRWLDVASTFQGSVSVQGVLDPVCGELLLSALAAYTPPGSWEDGRSPGQRRVDALAELCAAALGGPDVPGPRPQVTVTTSLDTLRQALGHDAAVLGPAGTPICAQTARRLSCDAGVIPAVLGSAGEPLDVGRSTRSIPTGIRRALALRDQGCRFPGCDVASTRTDGHHLRHWAHHGPTALTNLVQLCGFHHWLVHEGQWTIHYHAQTNTLTAARPDGTPYDLASGPRGQPP